MGSAKPDLSAEWLQKELPAVNPRKRWHEPALYGIDDIIARAIGYREGLPTKTTWQHGWCWNPILHPMQVSGGNPPELPRLVAQPRHADYLLERGFVSAHAVGMPFIYSGAGKLVSRIPNSLLVMPPHSLAWTNHGWDEAEYVDYISALKQRFSQIVACISNSCVQHGYWVGAFERAGIPWITGALLNDVNSLMRMHVILQSFDYVTTNAMGSHIPYAAFSGCKLSISGPYMTHTADSLRNDPGGYYLKNPDLLDVNIAKSQEVSVREHYPELFCDPWEAPSRREWGEEQLGFSCKQSPEQIAEFFGWNWRLRLTEGVRGSLRRADQSLRDLAKQRLPEKCVVLAKRIKSRIRGH